LFWGEDADNVDAELLRELYTPGHDSFSAYVHGQKNPDLRFIVNPAGAVPQLRSPEEVALINGDQNADATGNCLNGGPPFLSGPPNLRTKE
jgi:hypothetical protein